MMEERDLRQVEQMAKTSGKTVSAWVRDVLREAYSRRPTGQPKKKLEAIRAASQYAFPATDIEQRHELDTVFSFDRDFDKLPGVTRISGRDDLPDLPRLL